MGPPPPPTTLARLPFYYGWVQVAVAALAMVATLPGRTHGLGLITEPLLRDLQIERVTFAQINLWATLLGAAFCLPVGRLIDRYGTRGTLTLVTAGLGLVVLLMAGVSTGRAERVAAAFGGWEAATVVLVALAVTVTLTRGLGQSALSVVSLALVGKWFTRRLSVAMAFYSVLVALGFSASFKVLGRILGESGSDWRSAWAGVGLFLLLGLAPASAWLVRRTPEACGLPVDGLPPAPGAGPEPAFGLTLAEALRTPAFWVFAAATSLYGLISSGISLFNQSILHERGFDAATYFNLLTLTTLVGMASNFLGGWLGRRWALGPLLGLAMLVLSAALLALPRVQTHAHVVLYGMAMGAAGGVVTVVFFTVWGHAFGRLHLGRIQGVAQMGTVLASAVGPLLLAQCKQQTGSYTLMFYALAPVAALLGVCAWRVPVPDPSRAVPNSSSEMQGVLEHAGHA